MKDCVWCGTAFEPTTSYQIYCSVDCRQDATRQKIKERSRAALIKRRSKKPRMCVNGCGTQLSVYNDDKFRRLVLFPVEITAEMFVNLEILSDYFYR